MKVRNNKPEAKIKTNKMSYLNIHMYLCVCVNLPKVPLIPCFDEWKSLGQLLYSMLIHEVTY